MKTLGKGLVLEYVLWLLAGFLIAILALLSIAIFANPWFFSMVFLYLVFLPGRLLAKIFKLDSSDLVGRLLLFFILGLSFYFLVNFIAIALGLSLNVLVLMTFFLLIGLLGAAFIFDYRRPSGELKLTIKLKQRENLYYLLPVAVGIFILWWVNFKGAGLDGDPYLHLSIIRKALEGDSLSSRALALTKTQLINPAYVYPAWHIFLAFLSRIFSLDIFTAWTQVMVGLALVSFLSWYWLSRIIFQKTAWTILAFLLWLIFVFYVGPGYLFTRLSVPDTFAQLILLPLGLAFALKYIFQPERQLLLVNFLIAFMLLVLHGPHYFYLLILLIFFGVLYAATYWQNQDYYLRLRAFLAVVASQLAALVLVFAIIELRSQALTAAIIEFYKSSGGVVFSTDFTKLGLLYKYGLLLLPLTLVFWRWPKFAFIITAMLLVPVVYWTPLQVVFNKTLSGVFTDRLPANTSFYFFVLALIVGAIFLIKDYFFSRLAKKIQSFSLIGLGLIGLCLIILETKSHLISNFVYQIFYAKPTNAWVNLHYWWFLGAISLLAATILIIIYLSKIKKPDLEYKNHLFVFALMAILAYGLISPSIANVRAQIKEPPKLTGEAYFLYLINGDWQALDFIRQQIPAKSIILANANVSKGLATLADQYLAYSPGSSYEKKFVWVFDPANPDLAKAEIVSDPKWAIDYICLVKFSVEAEHFRLHPELYRKIFQNQQTEIYQVIK